MNRWDVIERTVIDTTIKLLATRRWLEGLATFCISFSIPLFVCGIAMLLVPELAPVVIGSAGISILILISGLGYFVYAKQKPADEAQLRTLLIAFMNRRYPAIVFENLAPSATPFADLAVPITAPQLLQAEIKGCAVNFARARLNPVLCYAAGGLAIAGGLMTILALSYLE